MWSVALFIILVAAIMPPVLDSVLDDHLNEIWQKKDAHDTWGVTPGKTGSRVLRQLTLNNISNPEIVMAGGKPKVIELGTFVFEEFGTWENWYYTDDDYNTLGQDTEGKYLAYNYDLHLMPIRNNETYIDMETPAAIINAPFLSALHSFHLGHALHGFWHLYDSIHNLETDFPY